MNWKFCSSVDYLQGQLEENNMKLEEFFTHNLSWEFFFETIINATKDIPKNVVV